MPQNVECIKYRKRTISFDLEPWKGGKTIALEYCAAVFLPRYGPILQRNGCDMKVSKHSAQFMHIYVRSLFRLFAIDYIILAFLLLSTCIKSCLPLKHFIHNLIGKFNNIRMKIVFAEDFNVFVWSVFPGNSINPSKSNSILIQKFSAEIE